MSGRMERAGTTLALMAPAFALAVGIASGQQVIDMPAQDRAITGRPDAVFSVGREEGEEWEVFSTVAAVAFDDAGNLYVLDRDNARVVVIGPDGRHVRNIGTRGEGPGEFVLPMSMTVLPDRRTAVFDMGNQAISLFDARGAYQSLLRVDPKYGTPRPDMVASQAGGLLMSGSQMLLSPDAPPDIRDSIPVLHVATDGAGATRVLVSAPSAKPQVTASGGANNRQIRMSPPAMFSPVVSWTPTSSGGVALAWGTAWEVSIVRPDGTTSSVLRRPIQARRVTDRDRDAAKEQRREQLETGAGMVRVTNDNGRQSTRAGGGLPTQQIEQMLAAMTFAETVPVIRRLRGDRDGRIWVQRDGGPGSTEYPIDIVSVSGTYLGTVRGLDLPDAFGPDGRFATIEDDDLGVQRVVVRRIPQTWLSGAR